MKKYILTAMKILFYLLPFALGLWGFTREFGAFSPGVIYSTLRLYTFNLDGWPDESSNSVLWIASFLAILVSTTLIANYVIRIRSIITLIWSTRKSEQCINVLGDEKYTKLFMQSFKLKKHPYKVISSKEKGAFNAKHIVILGKNRNESLELYESIEAKLKGNSTVYINIENTSSYHMQENRTIRVFGMNDNIARLFWREQLVVKPSRIVLIGFGGLGQTLLTQALQNNVASLNQAFMYHQYHVIGDAKEYLMLHPEMNSFVTVGESHPHKDSLYIHTSPWEDFNLLKHADMVIFCDDHAEVNANLLQTFVDRVPYNGEAYAYLENDNPLEYSVAMSKVHRFPSMQKLFSVDVVMRDQLQRLARGIHNLYKGSNQDIPAWESLDSFTIQSNEAQAEHMHVKLAMMKLRISESGPAITKEQFNARVDQFGVEKLAEMEHMRWSRFHWMNNWRYSSQISNGNKDTQTREHKCLVPYSELLVANKKYDEETIRSMYRIIDECGLYITAV